MHQAQDDPSCCVRACELSRVGGAEVQRGLWGQSGPTRADSRAPRAECRSAPTRPTDPRGHCQRTAPLPAPNARVVFGCKQTERLRPLTVRAAFARSAHYRLRQVRAIVSSKVLLAGVEAIMYTDLRLAPVSAAHALSRTASPPVLGRHASVLGSPRARFGAALPSRSDRSCLARLAVPPLRLFGRACVARTRGPCGLLCRRKAFEATQPRGAEPRKRLFIEPQPQACAAATDLPCVATFNSMLIAR